MLEQPVEGQNHRVLTRSEVVVALGRGWKRRCPRCGKGPLFRRGIAFYKRCPACHLLYQRDHGDTWMFMIITDRIPILFGIALVFFGFRASSYLTGAAFFLVLCTALLATLPQRQGLALALDYLLRVRLGDPTDEIHGGPQYVTPEDGTAR
jgi:uncharacterized protein (DUF983 family)